MKEKLQEYALIAEIIGGVAIVISLIFVGLQVRQSNTLAANDALKDGTQIWVDQYREAFGTEESTAFIRRGLNNYHDLNKDEQGRFFSLIVGFIAAFDNLYNQYNAGLLKEEVFISIASAYYKIINMPGAQQILTDNVKFVPRYLSDHSVNDVLIGKEAEIDAGFKFLTN